MVLALEGVIFSEARVPPDRQMVYVLELLDGVRPGGGSEADAALGLFDVTLLDSTEHGEGTATVGNVKSTHLSPGAYRLVVRCQNATPIPTSYPYLITVAIGG